MKKKIALLALAAMPVLGAVGCHVNHWNTPGGVASTVRG